MSTSSSSSTDLMPLSAADRSAIAALPERIVAAWAAHDANAFAEVFAVDGIMILPGSYRKGRQEIRSFMTDAFAGAYRGTQVTGEPLDIRGLGADSAVLITGGGVLAPDETEVAPERAIRASWVVVRQDGQWLLAAYQNSPANG